MKKLKNMNTKRQAFILLAASALLILFFISSCAGEADSSPEVPEIEIDINDLSDRLFEGIEYDDALGKVESYVIDMVYDSSELAVSSSGYCASGGTAEAVAVFECETENNADKLVGMLEIYKDSMAQDFVRYTPGEVEKLENTIIEKIGRYVIFCVSPDSDTAREIINNYISELQK